MFRLHLLEQEVKGQENGFHHRCNISRNHVAKLPKNNVLDSSWVYQTSNNCADK